MVTASNTTRSFDGGYRFLSQSATRRSSTGLVARAIARVAVTLALKRSSADGSAARSRACSSAVNAGAVQSWGWSAALVCAAMSAGLTAWLNRSKTIILFATVPPGRYHSVCSSLTVGVVNRKLTGLASLRPLTAVAVVSIVTS